MEIMHANDNSWSVPRGPQLGEIAHKIYKS